jgi:serine/threonine protein kinase
MARPQEYLTSPFSLHKLTGVKVTNRKLGRGSYATVIELEYLGMKCAGKKLHGVLLRQEDARYSVSRFEEECRLLSKVRHPNIVQFLGVYFQQGVQVQVPMLVMEFLPNNLTSCIERYYSILPNEIRYSILHDVSLGLCYLHGQTPPIIHRDLSSNNVLLTPNMTAKISDLGVAKILDLTPLQASRMTQAPGTVAYMPPEVMVANPRYDTSVDVFSYGIMMIHTFSGRWPEPQVGPVRTEPDDTMTVVTEAERREIFLTAIGNDHPLMDLILRSIHNDCRCRAHAHEIVVRLAEMVSQFPALTIITLSDQMIAHKDELQRKDKEIERKDKEIQEQREELQRKEEHIRDLERLLSEVRALEDRLSGQLIMIDHYQERIMRMEREGEGA